MKVKRRPVLLVALAIGFFFLLHGIAILFYEPPFSFISNNISRLCRPSWNPAGHYFAFAGMVLPGLLLLGFYPSLRKWKTGQKLIDWGIEGCIYLGYFSCLMLISLAVVNADHDLEHRILGGIYFFSDLAMMLAAIVLAVIHPRVHKVMLLVILGSAITNALYLNSGGKLSWAEWSTVLLSFSIALYLAWAGKQLKGPDEA